MEPKVIASGEWGSISISASAGVGKLSLALSEEVGGGKLAGVFGVSGALALNFDAKKLADVLLEDAKAAEPIAAPVIDVVEGIVDAGIAKV